jgi:uncharacterized membrane protein YczE
LGQYKLKMYDIAALGIGLLFTGFGTSMMKHAGFGLSAFAAVGLSLFEATKILTMGIWNWIFQFVIILLLMAIMKCFKTDYLISFIVVAVYSVIIDFGNYILKNTDGGILSKAFFWIIGFFLVCTGIAFFFICKLPIMPVDLFTREISIEKHMVYRKVKISFDLSCLIISILVGILFVKKLVGIGFGTVIAASCTGLTANYLIKSLKKYIDIISVK